MAEAEHPTTAPPQAPATPSVQPARPARLTSLPNMLGVARIAATPVVIALLLYPFPGAGLLACLVFWAAAMTDFVDGRWRGHAAKSVRWASLWISPPTRCWWPER